MRIDPKQEIEKEQELEKTGFSHSDNMRRLAAIVLSFITAFFFFFKIVFF